MGKWHLYQGEGKFVPNGPLRFGFEDWSVWSSTNKHHDGLYFNQVTGEAVTMPGYHLTRFERPCLRSRVFLRAAGIAGLFGAMINQYAPIHGSHSIQLTYSEEK